MTQAVQTSAMPTNKMATGIISTATISLAWGEVMQSWYPPFAGDGVSALAGALIAFIIAYFVKDRPNVPVE